jgi:hypothetical protein
MTAAQKARCREIADALDRGDLEPWRRAEGSLGAEARGLIWYLRQHVVAVGQRKQQVAAAHEAAHRNAVARSGLLG